MNDKVQQLHNVWAESRSCHDTSYQSINFETLTNSIISTGPFYYYIIDFYYMSLSNISPCVYDIHGLDPETLVINDIIETIHPEDIEFVANAEALITKFFQEKINREKLLNYKMNYSFRSRLKNGEYVLLNHQALLLTLDSNGKSGKSLNIHTRIDHLSNFNTYKISLIGLNGEPSFMNLGLEDNFQNTIELSKREIDIIKLIAEGFSNNNIAEKLCISPLTVKKHRKNILDKSEAKNTAHLIKNCIIQGII